MSTGIEWTDETWNPILGCTHVSEGCDNCYAAREASGRLSGHPLYEGLAKDGKFTGKVRLVPERLDQPLRWRKPRMVFVNSMSDLFHDDVPDQFIQKVFAVMARAPQHTFQVLTKRPGRMASFLAHFDRVAQDLSPLGGPWPLPNVWLGTSVENQKWADVRIPKLLETPAAVRFLSCEPLLGPVHLFGPWHDYIGAGAPETPAWTTEEAHASPCDCGHGDTTCPVAEQVQTEAVDWVIVGGESGPKARPMHPDWARSLRDQCTEAGVPFFFKQWGEWLEVGPDRATHLLHAGPDRGMVTRESATRTVPVGSHGERTEDLVDRGHPYWVRIARVGKKRAGRELYGRTWDEMPEEVTPTT